MTTTIERLVECSGGWGAIATDYAADYAEPGYNLSRGKSAIVFGNWNPRRWPRDGEPELTREEARPDRLARALEWAGAEIEWSDEWATCDECRRAMRVQPDSYSWTLYGMFVNDAGYVCADCLRADAATYLEQYHNDYRNAVTWAREEDLETAGYVQWEPDDPQQYENGWYPGQTDDPKTIAAEIRRHDDDAPIVFVVDGVGQFDVRFSAWYVPSHVHQWNYRTSRMAGTPIRECACGEMETYWEDDDTDDTDDDDPR